MIINFKSYQISMDDSYGTRITETLTGETVFKAPYFVPNLDYLLEQIRAYEIEKEKDAK